MFFSIFILGVLLTIFLVIMNKKTSKKYKTKKHKKSKRREKFLNKFTINECNKILVENETDCNCFDRKGYPTEFHNECVTIKHANKCNDYNTCKNKFLKYMSGNEPEYNP